MKKKAFWIIFICLITIAAAGYGAYRLLFQTGGDVKFLVGGKLATRKVKMKDLSLIPGGEKTHTLEVECETGGEFLFTFDFDEIEDDGLRSFVTVEIFIGETSIGEKTLVELFEGDAWETRTTLVEGQKTSVTFVYKMDSLAGDEAQGTSSDFEIEIKAKLS